MKVFVLFDIENSCLGNMVFAGHAAKVYRARNIFTIVHPAASKG